MKVCLQCERRFEDKDKFCLKDGSMLQDIPLPNNSTDPLFSNVSFNQSQTLSLTVVFCFECGMQNKIGSKFCKRCGTHQLQEVTPLIETPITVEATQPLKQEPNIDTLFSNQKDDEPKKNDLGFFKNIESINEEEEGRDKKRILIFSGGILALLLIICGIAWYASLPHPSEKKLVDAITNNQLMLPQGASAVDYYHQLKADGVKPETIKKYEERLIPIVLQKPQKTIDDFTVTGADDPGLESWQESLKLLEWANEMKPNDNLISAKIAYCKGRVAYISKNTEQSIELWKQAADLDKSWALHMNGIGVIYNERKDYSTARVFLFDAMNRNPKWANPYNNIGTSYFYENNLYEAENYYLQAIERAPDWARPHAWLGTIAMKNQDYSRAVHEFEKVLSSNSTGSLNIDEIRQKLEKARNLSQGYAPY